MPKGSKRVKGVPELQDELKTRVNLSLTPTAIANLDVMAIERGISKSELVERIARRQIPLNDYRDPLRDASVAALVERVIQELPPLDITISKVKFIPFNNREKLPNSPGAYLITNWQYEYIDSTNDLKERLMNEEVRKSLQEMFKDKEDNILLFWIECNDARLINVLQKEIRSVFRGIREDIISQSLCRKVQEKDFIQTNENLSNDLYTYISHIASTGKKRKLPI
ncbi:MAG: ribbon-helix-helix protein, CopG family [Nostoc sp. NMS7]|uniref:ribbon-helix-helix domain-containing protein n=1 Tax=Nostoc sp. NMS7 TaxID=2815391 RepID=UPI0025EAC44E|nr:CopG family transcriptional regulator [Nostoc sp. NMS7]MBN3950472.1 ribbon-helix-helix protein, CopG family [Nostoc sp. NMS7]